MHLLLSVYKVGSREYMIKICKGKFGIFLVTQSPFDIIILHNVVEEIHIVGNTYGSYDPEDGVPVDAWERFSIFFHLTWKVTQKEHFKTKFQFIQHLPVLKEHATLQDGLQKSGALTADYHKWIPTELCFILDYILNTFSHKLDEPFYANPLHDCAVAERVPV